MNTKNPKLLIQGSVRTQVGIPDKVEIQLFEKDKLVQAAITDSDGFFCFKLDFNSFYQIVFHKNHYQSKSIEIDTWTPNQERHLFYRFDVGLVESMNEEPLSMVEKPSAIVMYNHEYHTFMNCMELIDQMNTE